MISGEAIRRRQLIYMAHPVRPLEKRETIAMNLSSAKRCLGSLITRYPQHVFIAPWITECELFDDSDEKQRAEGLARCHAVIAKCDQFWMVGTRISSGMQGEARVAEAFGIYVLDLTGLSIR